MDQRKEHEPCNSTAQDKGKGLEMENQIILERISGLIGLNKELTELSKTIVLCSKSDQIIPYYRRIQEQLMKAIKAEAYSLRIEQ